MKPRTTSEREHPTLRYKVTLYADIRRPGDYEWRRLALPSFYTGNILEGYYRYGQGWRRFLRVRCPACRRRTLPPHARFVARFTRRRVTCPSCLTRYALRTGSAQRAVYALAGLLTFWSLHEAPRYAAPRNPLDPELLREMTGGA